MMRLDQRMVRVIGAMAVLLLASSAHAGDIKGKVTAQGMKSAENIAVYVDAIPGKEFPAPAQSVVMDQKNLKFAPHVLVVLKGTTVDFLNSDSVGHNVYWPSISGNKKLAHNLGTWPQGQKKSFQFNDLGCSLAAVQRSPGDVRLCGRGSHALFRGDRQGRQLRHQGRSAGALQPGRLERRGQAGDAGGRRRGRSATVDLTVKK